MIMACLNEDSGTVPCYTFGSMYRDTYDVRVSRTIATRCGQPHRVLVLGEDFVRASSEYLEKGVYISDGYMGLSGAAELYLNRQARSIAPVRVTGNYGGELLRGFRAFKGSVPNGQFLTQEFTARVGEALKSFESLTSTNPLSFTLFHQAPAGYGRYALERSQVTVRSPFLDDRLTALLYRAPRQVSAGVDPSTVLIQRKAPHLLSIATDRGFLGRGGSFGRGVRRAHREFLFKGEYLTGHGAPHRVAALTAGRAGRLLERAFVGRHKFLHPRIWMRGSLGQYANDTVMAEAKDSLAPFVDERAIVGMLAEHRLGSRNYWAEIDKLLTVALSARSMFGTDGGTHGALDLSGISREDRGARSTSTVRDQILAD